MRIGVLAVAIFLGALGVATASSAQPSLRRPTSIPPQSLAPALQALAKERHFALVYRSELIDGIDTSGAAGELTAAEALARLLDGTGLGFRFLDEKTVTIFDPLKQAVSGQNAADTRTMSPSSPVNGELRLAQADSSATRDTPANGEASSATADDQTASRRVAAEENPPLEEVLVTGTHIRGADNQTAPVIVLDRAYIESTGIGTTVALIESLPQNFALASQSGINVPGVSDGATSQGASINLRGIGEGTTLTLVNGRRLALGFLGSAADISALPLSAIDRVEVLTDGASALYGSDAVGGVVNFILRRDFKGGETQLRSGWAEGGVNEYRASQALGSAWESGNALLSVEYYKRDLLLAGERDFVPPESDIGSLFPRDKTFSALFSGRQDLAESVSTFADVLYMNRDSFNVAGRSTFNKDARTENPQLSTTLGLDWKVAADWQVELFGSYARNRLRSRQSSTDPQDPNDPSPYFAGPYSSKSLYTLEGAQLKADGSLFTLPGGKVRAALGMDWRSESLDFSDTPALTGAFGQDQTVRSLFGEMYVPIVASANHRRAINRLELSVAGRFDEYSNFGSSFDPRFGLMWEPLAGLRLRGSYGTSYVAPKLLDYNLSLNGAFAYTFTDPDSPTGSSRFLEVFGNDVASYKAQQSESFSLGVEFDPASAGGLELGLNYYRINYRDRIADSPFAFIMLANPESFSSQIIRSPTSDQVNEMVAFTQQGSGLFICDFDAGVCNLAPSLDPSSVDVIVDTRRRNVSRLLTSGVDASVKYQFEVGGGNVQLGLAGTYIFEIEQRVTQAAAPFDTVDTIYNPPQWRMRGSFGWQRRGWAANLFVNHTDSYTDNRDLLPVPVPSYTTLDVNLAYDFAAGADGGLLSGVTVSACAQNLLDRDPPRIGVLQTFNYRDMGFDPTNANPMGRLVALELKKTW